MSSENELLTWKAQGLSSDRLSQETAPTPTHAMSSDIADARSYLSTSTAPFQTITARAPEALARILFLIKIVLRVHREKGLLPEGGCSLRLQLSNYLAGTSGESHRALTETRKVIKCFGHSFR